MVTPSLDSLSLLFVGGGALFLLLLGVVVLLNIHGKRLDKHAEVLRLLSLRVDNLHRDRKRTHARVMQTVRPPPLSEARTTELPAEMLLTLKLQHREDGGRGENR